MRRLNRTIGTALAVSVTLALAASAAPGEEGFAYLTTLGLAVRAGERPIGQADGFFADATLRWTNDGRYAMAVSRVPGERPTGGTIVAVDAANGRVLRVPCECWDVLPVGAGAGVIQVTGWGRLKALTDLGGPVDWREIPRPAPPDQLGPDDPWPQLLLVGSDGGKAYLTTTPQSGLGPPPQVDLYVTDGVTESASLGKVDIGDLAASAGHAASPSLALIHRRSGCDQQDNVTLASTAERTLAITRFVASDSTERWRVFDSWWGRDGQLYATAASWSCTDGSVGPQTTSPAVWHFDGRRWNSTDRAGVLSLRELPSGQRLVIGVDRKLTADGGSGPVHIDDDVSQIAVRP